jgi:hypothetical protein
MFKSKGKLSHIEIFLSHGFIIGPMRSLIFHETRILPRDLINMSWEKKISNGILLFRVFKNCIIGKYEEILVNTFHSVKYRVILQQNQYFVCFAILKTSSNCGLTALI